MLKDAYRQLPSDGRATLVVLVSRGEVMKIPFGIVHGDIFQSLLGRMQITFQAIPHDPDSFRMGPSFRDRFVHGTKHRRLGLVAGLVVSGIDTPSLRFYVIHNPYGYRECTMPPADFARADQFCVDDDGYGEVQLGLPPAEVWPAMAM